MKDSQRYHLFAALILSAGLGACTQAPDQRHRNQDPDSGAQADDVGSKTDADADIKDPDPVDPIPSNCNLDAPLSDENCAGILERMLFVDAVEGADVSSGGKSPGAPLSSIRKALEMADYRGRDIILVTGGGYEEALTLENGVSIYGGYNSEFELEAGKETRVEAPGNVSGETITIYAANIDKRTVLDNLIIVGAAPDTAGASTAALRAHNASGLIVQNSQIIGGAAAQGGDGLRGEDRSCPDRPQGGDGGPVQEYHPCTDASESSTSSAGESGEASRDGTSGGAGGVGGRHACSASDNGRRAGEGRSGAAGVRSGKGTHGSLPDESAIGSLRSNGAWEPAAGDAPTHGIDGSGGGGGGAGGNYERPENNGPPWFLYVQGVAGGKGGDGGCGGKAGENGQPGGSSFGIVILKEPIIVRDTEITLGRGGDGGSGSKGGGGGNGEPGTDENVTLGAGTSEYTRARGGIGGSGGKGGDGGNGVGGQGGNAFGLVTLDAEVDASTLQFKKGGSDYGPRKGGRGGHGATGNRDDGRNGAHQKSHAF